MTGHRTIIFWKPHGVLTKFTDSEGRKTLADHIDLADVYPAGRLDRDSEGLLILSSNPKLRGALTASRHRRTYLVQVEGIPDTDALQRLRQGVVIQGRATRTAEARLVRQLPDLPPRPIRRRKSIPDTWIELTLREGRNRQVRRMTAAVGHPTLRLVRWSIGPITLDGLGPGQWRDLETEELAGLEASLSRTGTGGRRGR